jgi:hypothetical protein
MEECFGAQSSCRRRVLRSPRSTASRPRPPDPSGRTRSARTSQRERHILEHAIHAVAEQAAKADNLVDEAIDLGHGRSDPLVTHAKMLRLELLKVKADLERELADFVPNCKKCGLDVHWVSGLGVSPGHWAHREPAPHGDPYGKSLWCGNDWGACLRL